MVLPPPWVRSSDFFFFLNPFLATRQHRLKIRGCESSNECGLLIGAFLLGAGTKGKRKALPNARIMIHQPLGGAQGQAADIEIQAREILFVKNMLNTYMSAYTGKPMEQLIKDTDRDFFMDPVEAKEYGIIDEVIQTRAKVPKIHRQDLTD